MQFAIFGYAPFCLQFTNNLVVKYLCPSEIFKDVVTRKKGTYIKLKICGLNVA